VSRLTDATAMVEIRSFSQNISQKLKEELAQLRNEGVKNLIIDLRNNEGGVFIEGVRTAELFIPEKKILVRTVQRDPKLVNYVSSNPDPFVFSIGILVNRKTASAAEILAASLVDHREAFIVGSRTFGKGVMEKTFTLDNDYKVKFITGALYSPAGASWQGRGLLPDFLVDQDEKTVAALLKMDPKKRMEQDVAVITAYKLLVR
jgi:carboxyl-terminal processing protease